MTESLSSCPAWLRPDLGVAGVGALMTTRQGGVSDGPWRAMNLGDACGDDPRHVAANRSLLMRAIDARPVFLRQVHGVTVARLSSAGFEGGQDIAATIEADASVTTEPGIACTVLAADCLPLLFAAPDGRAVAAAHAGWRGLASGVVEATLKRLCDAAGCRPAEVHAWLGACIGPRHFQVGADVLEAFDQSKSGGPRFMPQLPGKWLADLPGLARDRLEAAGVTQVSGGSWCTVTDAYSFFSYRRSGITGRMGASIWIERSP